MPNQLTDCPICKKSARIGYACGDYFVYCSDGCISPMCDHPALDTTRNHWNSWATAMKQFPIKRIHFRIIAMIRRFQLKHKLGPYSDKYLRRSQNWKKMMRKILSSNKYLLIPDIQHYYSSWKSRINIH